jgi:L-fuconolactonase
VTARVLPGQAPLRAADLVDSHVHVWDLESSRFPWHADLGVTASTAEPIEGLLGDMRSARVPAALVVQSSMYGFDHAYLEYALARDPAGLRGIALVDPLNPATPELIRKLAANPSFVGLRMIPVRTDRDWFGDAATPIWEAAADLSLAMTFLAGPAHLQEVARWASRFPTVPVVIDHLGRPDLAERRGLVALRPLLVAAKVPNCHVKLSGIGGLSKVPPPHEDTWPWVQAVVDGFGSDRILWGSDHPWVKSYGSSIEESLSSTALALADLDVTDTEAILGGNAQRLFGFEGIRSASAGRSARCTT